MDVRRGVAAGLVGLALVAGTAGCGKIGEKVAEEAIERNSDCEDIDIDADEGAVSGSCSGDGFDASVSGDAELPAEWPADLAVPEGLAIVTSTSTDTPVLSLNVVGSVDGEVPAVYETIKTQLTAAGFTIDTDSLAEGPTGPSGTLAATGPELTAAVVVADNVSGIGGPVSVTYSLTALG
ncbi:hypothetical protein HC251_11225 [Iamia sp. SCSIO 61187]|uniref:hypothetical protein n=1 Tax=Iamia sp. SCSIO 61187 TaxID=2722752 RepID=UPI001C63100B|nr:hypothetical protein [Iamia sp. SCSIO 61187]QYG92944.1 hypothetical protein HC251_11225 [Iamia sp. SCSIO 61187]